MQVIIDLVLVGGGLFILITGLVIRKISSTVSKGTEYVYNTGLMTRLGDFTQVKAAEMKKAAMLKYPQLQPKENMAKVWFIGNSKEVK